MDVAVASSNVKTSSFKATISRDLPDYWCSWLFVLAHAQHFFSTGLSGKILSMYSTNTPRPNSNPPTLTSHCEKSKPTMRLRKQHILRQSPQNSIHNTIRKLRDPPLRRHYVPAPDRKLAISILIWARIARKGIIGFC